MKKIVFSLQLTPQERAELARLARIEERSASDVLRRLLRREIARLANAPSAPPLP